MKKYLKNLIKKSKKFLNEYSNEIDYIKNSISAISALSAFILLGKAGIVITVLAVYFNAANYLKKYKFARLTYNKIRNLRLANLYATILFSIGFWIAIGEWMLK